MVVTSSTRYIARDRDILDGEPIIVGTQVPVRDIVALWQDDIRPEDIPAELYNLVSTAQVFDAISFYLDNQAEVDEYMERYRRLGGLSRSAILLSHSPFWDELAESIEVDRQALDVALEADSSAR